MGIIRKGLLESVVQSGSIMAARLSLIAGTFVVGFFQPLAEVTQFDSFAIVATFIALGLGLGLDSGLSLVAAEDSPEQRHLMLWVALAFPTFAILPVGLVILGAQFWLDPILLTWGQWGLAAIFGYLQVNLTIAYTFDRFSGSAIWISLEILGFNLLGFGVGSVLLAQGGHVSDFIVAYVIALALGNLWVIPRHLWRHPVPGDRRAEALAVFRKLVGFSIWYLMSSLTLLMRRPIERVAVLAVGSPEILGSYIIVSRLAELVGLLGTVLSSGFMPIIIRRYHDADGAGKALARYLLNGYFALSVGLIVGAAILSPLFLDRISFPDAYPVMPILLLLIAANSLLGAISLSGQGFTLTRKGYFVGLAGAVLIVAFAGLSVLFVFAGLGIWAAPLGLLCAAAICVLLIVQGSEYLAPVGYSIWWQIVWMVLLIGLAFTLGYSA